MSCAFYNTKIMANLNISNWTIVKNYSADSAFDTSGITAFSFGDDTFGTEGYGGPTDAAYMFSSCNIKKFINNDERESALIKTFHMFTGNGNYLDTIEGKFYLPNVTDCSYMFSLAGPSSHGIFNYLKEGSLSKCTNFMNMFNCTRYEIIYLDNINSQVVDSSISCLGMFSASSSGSNNLKNVYMRNANFKTSVSLQNFFSRNWSLRFVDFDYKNNSWDNSKYYDGTYTYYGMDTPDTSDDTNNDHVTNLENLFDKDYPDATASTMAYMFSNCSSLRGLPDNFFTAMNIKSVTNCSYMFSNAGIEAILGDIRNKFGVVIDFKIPSNSNVSYMFNGVKNFSYIKFTQLTTAYTASYMFSNVGSNEGRITDLTIDLSSVTTNLLKLITDGFTGTKGKVPIKIITKADQATACKVYNSLKTMYPTVTVTHTDGVTVLDQTKC